MKKPLNELAATLGARGGRKAAENLGPELRSERAKAAGKQSGVKMTPEQRTERARKAGLRRQELARIARQTQERPGT